MEVDPEVVRGEEAAEMLHTTTITSDPNVMIFTKLMMEEDKSTFAGKPSISIKEQSEQHDNETAEAMQNTEVITDYNEITSNKPINAAESCIVAQDATSIDVDQDERDDEFDQWLQSRVKTDDVPGIASTEDVAEDERIDVAGIPSTSQFESLSNANEDSDDESCCTCGRQFI